MSDQRQVFWRGEGGAVAVEWTLLLVAFGLPMMALFRLLLALLTQIYGMVSFLETCPLP
jgi:Flp pilus assembly pilin Flp